MADIPAMLRDRHPDWPAELVDTEAALIAAELEDFREAHETPGLTKPP